MNIQQCNMTYLSGRDQRSPDTEVGFGHEWGTTQFEDFHLSDSEIQEKKTSHQLSKSEVRQVGIGSMEKRKEAKVAISETRLHPGERQA